MKTAIQLLLAYATGLFSLTAVAQCPNINSFSTTIGVNGTATVTPVITGSVNTNTHYYWSGSNGTLFTNSYWESHAELQVYANGVYSVCVSLNDSIQGCSTSQCTTVNITNAPDVSCNASFSSYTDSNCVTHFSNTSTGANLTSYWYKVNNNGQYTFLSTANNPNLTLQNGQNIIGLYSYSSGQFCDSITQVVNVNCSGNPQGNACQASFYSYTDSLCLTHFINTSISAFGDSISSQWNINGYIYNTTDVTLNLANGVNWVKLTNYANGIICDSTTQYPTINCSGSSQSNTCQASFYTYTDSLCRSHFINTSIISIGSNINYQWYINGDLYGAQDLILNLGNGSYSAQLYNYSNGVLCDSVMQNIIVNCNYPDSTSQISCQVNSSFTVFNDSTNIGNYFAYNMSTGNGVLSYLWNFGDGTTSTQQYPFHQYATPGQYIICLTVTSSNDSLNCSSTHCDSSSIYQKTSGFIMSQINILPQNTTGIKSIGKPINFSAYPNPLTDKLTIESEEYHNTKYFITDAIGKIVITGNINNQKTIINTSELAKGFYNLTISNEKNQKKNIKLIK